jgi:hypothetical protein
MKHHKRQSKHGTGELSNMDIERLKEDIRNIEYELEYGEEDHFGRIAADVNCLRSVIDFANEAIARQSVKSEDVQREISRLTDALKQTKEAAKELKEQKYAVNMLPVYNQIKSLELQITALQAYQPWIPVSNVKPEKSGRYVAYVPEHWTAEVHKEGKVIIAYFRELNYEGKRRTWDDGAYGISGEVTHYLPLPELPKGE